MKKMKNRKNVTGKILALITLEMIQLKHLMDMRGRPGCKPGDKEGNYHNPETGESLRPDLDHNPPIGKHWDYRDPDDKWHKIFPDGSVVPKP